MAVSLNVNKQRHKIIAGRVVHE